MGRWIPDRVGLLGCKQEDAAYITKRVLEGAKGMFLWARLMVEHLLQQATLNEIFSALDDLPNGLESLYDRLLEQLYTLPPARFNVVQNLLQWTLFAI